MPLRGHDVRSSHEHESGHASGYRCQRQPAGDYRSTHNDDNRHGDGRHHNDHYDANIPRGTMGNHCGGSAGSYRVGGAFPRARSHSRARDLRVVVSCVTRLSHRQQWNGGRRPDECQFARCFGNGNKQRRSERPERAALIQHIPICIYKTARHLRASSRFF